MLSVFRLVLVVLSSVMFSSTRLSYGRLNPADGTSNTCSYGADFWVPFPGIAVSGLTSFFQYRVYLTNPNNLPITITMSAVLQDPMPSQTLSVSAGATRFLEYDASYMMPGEGIFRNYARLTSSNNFSVYVMATEKMDAFTALPVTSWGKKYMAATYCGQSGGPCQIVVIAREFTKVVVSLPAQEYNTMSSTGPLAAAMEVSQMLSPGDVYQLQRNFDISGAIIYANVSVGVLTGSASSAIAKGQPAGAFMEFLPPVSTLGSSFVVYKTPPWSSSSDLIRVVALNNGTNVYISTGHRRFQLQGSQYITRKFHQNVLLLEASQPVLVVKYTQNGQYSTMTLIPPTVLYLLGETVIINEVAGLTNKQQFIIVVATKDFMQYMQIGPAVPITGTNMAAIVLRVPEGSGNFTLVGPKQPKMSFMAYSYLISDTVSFQTAVAFYQLAINQPCYVTKGSPGDQTDNDCDGQIDEDLCSESNYMSFSDCGAIISGDRDIWGKEFALQVPDHCQSSLTDDLVLLYVTARSGGTAIQVALDTPADLTKVRKTMTVGPSDNYQIFNLTGAAIKGNGSKLLSGQTLHLISSAEVSVTLLQVCTSIGSESIMTSRLIPCDVMSREYFAVTLCNFDLCQIQIAAFHRGITQVRIRLRLQNASTPFMFNSVEYKDGEVISVSLSQFQSLQLQSNEQDMTGTHILASKPVSVFSGGRYTMFKRMHMSNGFVEQLPPVETWGRYFIVQSSPVTESMNKCSSRLCLDYLKIVAGTADTVVQVRGNNETSYTLSAAGDFLELPLPAVNVTVQSNKPILVLQLTQEVANIALSGSVVTAADHYLSAERVAVPGVDGVEMYLMINMDHTNAQEDTVVVNNSTVALTSLASLNASFYSTSVIGEDFIRVSSNRRFGGHIYSSGNLMAGLFRLAYALTEINPVCPISKGVPGDNKDNDCDGLIDEEPCQPFQLATDADDDGMANEDCSSPPVSSSISASFDPSPTEPLAVSTSLSLLETTYVTTAGYTTLSPMEPPYVTTGRDDTTLSLLETPYVGDGTALSPSETRYVTTAAVDTALSLLETAYVTTAGDEAKVSSDHTDFMRVSGQPSYITPSSTLAASVSSVLSSSVAWTSIVTELAWSPTATTPDSRSSSFFSEHLLSTTRTTSGPATSPSMVTNGIACGCHCPRSLYASVLDPSQVALLTQAIQKELSINRNDVSANRRKYISIDDHRPSAQTVGYFGIGIIMATFLGICLLDASAITRDIAGFIQLCRVQK